MKAGVEYQVVSGSTIPTPGEKDVVLAFGKERLIALQSAGHGPKKRAITSQRGLVLGTLKERYMVTWDAPQIAIDWARRSEIQWDIYLAARLVRTGSLDADFGDYQQCDDLGVVVDRINELWEANGKKPVSVSIDLETVGTDHISSDAWIVALSVTVEKGQSYVMLFDGPGELDTVQWEYLQFMLNGGLQGKTKVYGANFKFDMLWICEKWGIDDFSAFRMDTTLVGSLLDENRSNSLNLHAKVYCPELGGYDDQFNRVYDKTRMDLIPKPDLVTYAGGDTDAVYRVVPKLKKNLIKNRRLARFYTKLLHPAQNAFRKIEQRGMCVDQDAYHELDSEVTQIMEQAQETMISLLPTYLKNRYAEDLRPSRPKIIADYLFHPRALALKPKLLTEKTKVPSTSGEHFDMFVDHPRAGPFIQALRTYRQAEKTKSTYIDGFLAHLREDGKFHPSYMLFRGRYHGDDAKADDSGGKTGRTSCKDPAYQTIPKHTIWAKPLRRVYVPPPGMCILNIDFSQGELRVTACIADEPTMLQTYRDNIDLHLKTGAQLNGIELAEALEMKASNDKHTQDVIAKIRQGGKAGNFGLIYGMGAEGFMEYARLSYGVILSKREAQAFRNEFFGLYDQLEPWHEHTKEIAHRDGYIVSPLGRVRRVPLINSFAQDIVARQERQAINAGVQSTLTDMGLLAAAELDRRYPDLWCFGFTHDALSFYVPEEEAMDWARRIKHVMENLPFHEFGWEPQLPFPVDVEWGLNNMADVVEMKIAA